MFDFTMNKICFDTTRKNETWQYAMLKESQLTAVLAVCFHYFPKSLLHIEVSSQLFHCKDSKTFNQLFYLC